jgi:hypothetical protein
MAAGLWAGAPVKGVVDGLAVDGRGNGVGEAFAESILLGGVGRSDPRSILGGGVGFLFGEQHFISISIMAIRESLYLTLRCLHRAIYVFTLTSSPSSCIGWLK